MNNPTVTLTRCSDYSEPAIAEALGRQFELLGGLEKLVRDLRVHQILEGTNEIMRVVIARKVLGGNRG